jgi:hypothetical protein
MPFAYHADAPVAWLGNEIRGELGEEQCVIANEAFFVRGLIRLPVSDADQDFEWGVWVSLSEQNFARANELWETPGREREEPYFAWVATALPLYSPTTLNLKAHVHTRPVGLRPMVELESTDHPLAVEQREGITLARVQQIAESLLHAD